MGSFLCFSSISQLSSSFAIMQTKFRPFCSLVTLFLRFSWHQLGVRVLLKCSKALLVNSLLDLFCDRNHDHLYYILTVIFEKILRKTSSIAFTIWLLCFYFYVQCITYCLCLASEFL